jgi:Uma2 family endonuclease
VVRLAPADVVLSAHDVVQPDLFYVQRSRAEIIGGRLYGPPDLVIEVASPSTAAFDRGQTLHRYEHIGVRWYCIADPIARTVEKLELIDRRYVRRSVNSGGAAFAPALFPGLTIDLSVIWPDPELTTRETRA